MRDCSLYARAKEQHRLERRQRHESPQSPNRPPNGGHSSTNASTRERRESRSPARRPTSSANAAQTHEPPTTAANTGTALADDDVRELNELLARMSGVKFGAVN